MVEEKKISSVLLVTFVYGDGEGDFVELTEATERQKIQLENLLVAAEDGGRVKKGWYVGPLQEAPTPFDKLLRSVRNGLELEEQE